MDDDEVTLVEASPRRIANIMADERIFTNAKTKRKRCDTWHGDENKNEQQLLDPDIEQGLNTKRKFARYVERKKYVFNIN